jgi:hypothetical protein
MIDFVPETNWLSIFDMLIMAIYTSRDPDIYIPIAPIALNNSLTHRFLRVAANNQNAKSAWQHAGYIEFLTDEVSGAEVFRHPLLCNRAIIIPVPDYLERYRVTVTTPFWFDELSLQVDGYL